MALNKPTGDMLNAGSNSAAQDLGTAAAGTSSSYSRADHVHKKPSAADVGAIATSQLGALSGVATLDGAGKLTTAQIPALTTAQISQISPAAIGAVATGDVIAINKGGTGSTTAAAARTALDITPATIGAMATGERAGLATLTAGTLTTTQALALTGDVTSAAGNPSTVVGKIQGKAISNATPTTGQTLVWDGAQWAPATSNNTGGGGGANGLTYFLNEGNSPDAPVTNIQGTVYQLGRVGVPIVSTINSGTLTKDTWTPLIGFVSGTLDPEVALIPAGLWDANVWAFGDGSLNDKTSIRTRVYVYSTAGGGTLTPVATSASQVVNGTVAQYALTALVPQTEIVVTDRIYIAIEALAITNGHSVTVSFGGTTPSHLHTSLPLVGGTGLWKSVAGYLQPQASLLVNADVDALAAIANSKIAGLAASATTDTTNASNITTGTLRTDQLSTISGLPAGAQGSATVIPSVTVDAKGRVTALTTAALASYVLTSNLTTAATASKVPQLDAAGKLSTAQVPALTTAQISQITPAGIGAVATDQLSTLAKLSGSTLRTDQMAALTGDVTSAAGNPATTVEKLRGRTVAATAPASGQVLSWDGTQWAPAASGAVFYATVRQTTPVTPDTIGVYLLTYTAGSPTVTCTNVGGSAGLTVGSTFSATALRAFTITAISGNGLDVTMSGSPSINATSQNNSAYRGTNTTFIYPTGAQVIDGRTIEIGDVVFFTAQVATAQNGPWVCTTKGATGISQVLTRPSWFTGMAYPLACTIQQGPTSQGLTCNLYPTTVGAFDITVGVTPLTARVISQRGDNALLTSNITGTAANVTGTVAVANGGTGATTLTGLVKGTGTTAMVAATAGTDYVTPSGNITGTAGGLSATLAVASGGTGQNAYTNGQLLIGNTTGSTLTKATLTQGSGIAITNGAGAITVAYAPTVSTVAPTSGDGANGDFWYQY